LNEIYYKFLNDKQNIDFEKDMQKIIDIFIDIFENPSDKILEGCSHTNKEIIDLIEKTDIINKTVFKAIGGLVSDKTNANEVMNALNNDKMKLLFDKIREIRKNKNDMPINKSNSKTRSIKSPRSKSVSYKSLSPNKNSNSKTRSIKSSKLKSVSSLSPIEGAVKYIGDKNASLFDSTRKRMIPKLQPKHRTRRLIKRRRYK
jgi:hypothetical protein